MVVLIVIAAILYALFDLFAAKGADHTNAYIANVIFNGLGALIPLVIFVMLKTKQTQGQTTKYGVLMNVLAGISIAAFSILLVKIFARGGNLAYVLPLIYGIAIILGSLLGYVILKEHITLLQLTGIVVTALGIGIVVVSKL